MEKVIAVFTNFSRHEAVSELRLFGPLSLAGYKVIHGNELINSDQQIDLRGIDFLTIQRDFPRNWYLYMNLISAAKQANIPVIYDIDDLLWELPAEHPDKQSSAYVDALLPMLTAAATADMVTVSTPALLSYVKPINQNASLLPNYLNDTIWNLNPPKDKGDSKLPVVIGYMGTYTHNPDIKILLPTLLRLLKEYEEKLAVRFLGQSAPAELRDLPNVEADQTWCANYSEFAARLSNWSCDICVAPLAPGLFNHSKSPIKFFEYSSMGAAGVYSSGDPYEGVITDGLTGFLASTPEEWYLSIKRLIEEPQLRYQMVLAAQKMIREKWLLSSHIAEWNEVYEKTKTASDANSNGTMYATQALIHVTEQVQNLIESLSAKLMKKEQTVQALSAQVAEKEQTVQALSAQVAGMENSRGWKLVLLLRNLRTRIAPDGSQRWVALQFFFKGMRFLHREGPVWTTRIAIGRILRFIKGLWHRWKLSLRRTSERGELLTIDTIQNPAPLNAHNESVDIIVCVHNALEDARRCLASILLHTSLPYHLILVDDGSGEETARFLKEFAEQYPEILLMRNDDAQGYTFAANKGLRASKAEYALLLNSDTIVTSGWLDRLVACAESDDKIGIVGPLSNTASWQSIPKIEENGDWASNPLPSSVSVDQMGTLVANASIRMYPRMPLLNGFCLLLKKAMLSETGLLDEENFGKGYGEEDDLVLRARKLGWEMALADDVYVYHAQSRSYSSEKRKALSKRAGKILMEKHGQEIIQQGVDYCLNSLVLDGIRARSQAILDREHFLALGRKYAGKRVLFLLPIAAPGGGGNVVIFEGLTMKKMGVDVEIFNLPINQEGFLRGYPDLDLPVRFDEIASLPEICRHFDAVVATHNSTVEWLLPFQEKFPNLILGYYIQGFEPLMYEKGMNRYAEAMASYTLISKMARFTKTEWTRNEVLKNTGADSKIVGVDVDFDLFRPRPNPIREQPDRPLRIAAMIRPEAPYREPEKTMQLLKLAYKTYGGLVEPVIFGTEANNSGFLELTNDFPWKLYGVLPSQKVANLLNTVDIFIDYSSHQAMGLTALEAMATGCAVILPQNGGATSFCRHMENGMIADTSDFNAVWQTLQKLITDQGLRQRIQKQAVYDTCQYSPERVALSILDCLFGK